jgi:hypothetical protein
MKLLMCDFCHHLLTALGHNFDKPWLTTLYALLLVDMLFPEKYVVVWADVNFLIFQTKSRHYFLRLVHVFRHFMRLRKDIADKFYEIIVAIIREKVLGLNGHHLGDEGMEGHLSVFMQWLFWSFKNASTFAVGGSLVSSWRIRKGDQRGVNESQSKFLDRT